MVIKNSCWRHRVSNKRSARTAVPANSPVKRELNFLQNRGHLCSTLKETPMSNKVRVWDLPTRCFHWALVLCLVALLTTAQIGGDAMAWHFRSGYAVLSLLLFRLIWGVVGGKWSRFSSFLYAPAAVLAYLQGRGRPEHSIGHNPLGAASVFALLGFL